MLAAVLVLMVLALVSVRHVPFYLPEAAPPPPEELQAEGHRVFGYATLTRPLVRFVVVGRVVPAAPARLSGYERTGRFIYPTATGGVEGQVFTVDGRELWRLDRYEQQGTRYRRSRMELDDGSAAWVYIGTD